MLKYILTLALTAFALALPVEKRIYQPSSPVFTLIAEHEGGVLQANLVKFDENGLNIGDGKAFVGRIKGNAGYVLNLVEPSNSTESPGLPPTTTNILVGDDNRLKPVKGPASESFGIHKSLLTYKNSTSFVACSDESYRGEYSIFFGGNSFSCPENGEGYDITLKVQVDATSEYTPESNT